MLSLITSTLRAIGWIFSRLLRICLAVVLLVVIAFAGFVAVKGSQPMGAVGIDPAGHTADRVLQASCKMPGIINRAISKDPARNKPRGAFPLVQTRNTPGVNRGNGLREECTAARRCVPGRPCMHLCASGWLSPLPVMT